MEYEKLKELNDRLNKSPIKGKPYVMVNDRVQGFRELYPDGCIVTHKEDYTPDGYAVVTAAIYADNDPTKRPLATGMAQETVEKNRNINRTSMLENCETSAVGRALGFLGIGSVESIASGDEINKANNKEAELDEIERLQDELETKPISKTHIENIRREAGKIGIGETVIQHQYSVDDISKLTEAQYGDCMNRIIAESNKITERVIGVE